MTNRALTLVLASSLGVSLSSGAAAQRATHGGGPTHLIDLVASTPQPSDLGGVPESERLRVPFGRSGRPDHDRPLVAPFAMRLLGLDRTSYLVGDTFIYELLVSNTGATAVMFPNSPDSSRFRQDMTGAVAASVFLTFDDSSLGSQVIGSQTLFGAPAVSQSIVVIAPGETLQLRAKGSWLLQSSLASPVSRPWQRELHVKGALQVFSHSQAQPLIWSENTRDVVLASGDR